MAHSIGFMKTCCTSKISQISEFPNHLPKNLAFIFLSLRANSKKTVCVDWPCMYYQNKIYTIIIENQWCIMMSHFNRIFHFIEYFICLQCNSATQCPRVDLNKRFLHRPKTITAWKLTPHRSKISKNWNLPGSGLPTVGLTT